MDLQPPKANPETTTAVDLAGLVAWLRDQGKESPNACHQERDWCDRMNCAATEIERLREIVRLYVDPAVVKLSYLPIVDRCRP